MKAKFITISLIWALSHSMYAATHVVYPGENIQDKVAIATAGDTVIISGGSYPDQNIIMKEAIRLVREKGTTVTIGGLITLADIPTEVVLRDFAININGNGRLVIKNCTRVGLEDLTLLPEGITIENSTMVIRSCQMGPVSVSTDSNIELINSNMGSVSVSTDSNIELINSNVSAVTSNSSDIIVANTDFTTGSFTGGSALIQESIASGEVTFNTCNWRAHESTFQSNLKSIASDSKLIKSTVDLAFEHNGTQNDCTVFQSTVGRKVGSQLLTDANRSWISYSNLHHFSQKGGSYSKVSNNKIITDLDTSSRSVFFNGGQNTKMFFENNEVTGGSIGTSMSQSVGHRGDNWVTIKNIITSAFIESVSNKIWGEHVAYCRIKFQYNGEVHYVEHSQGNSWAAKDYINPYPEKLVKEISIEIRGSSRTKTVSEKSTSYKLTNGNIINSHNAILIDQSEKLTFSNNLFRDLLCSGPLLRVFSGSTEIHGNIFWRSTGSWSTHAIEAPAQSGSSATHNYFQDASYAVTGGLSNFDNITGGDPGFVDSANGDFRLSSSSQLKDAGPEEPEFNDHDGSRNDIGMYGGNSYDPDGTTSTYPVIVGGNQSTYRINIGETNPIVIKARAVVSTHKEN